MKDVADVLNKEDRAFKVAEIKGEACKNARSLWEEVFFEDSIKFTDYYFENKAEKNIGYVIGKAPFDAMMFRTPYTLQIGKFQREISYIVGVATRKECRHRGYMRTLLMHSFREMYREKNPFTFLMPANPAIYEPFDFQYIYERVGWEFKEPEKMTGVLENLTLKSETDAGKELKAAEFSYDGLKGHRGNQELNGLYSVRRLYRQEPDFPILNLLAEFADRYLKEHYKIYVRRDASYYEMQLKESQAQNGDIYVWFERSEMKAVFLYAKEEDEIFIQEVMEKEPGVLGFLQKTETKKPIIMARIIHLEEMMKMVCGKENTTMVIEIEDELIPENTGIFRWKITPNGSEVIKIHSEISDEKELSMHIRDFAAWVLTGVFINEIV